MFTITAEEINSRLDKFLHQKLPQYSRSFLQKTIKDGLVLVNDKAVTPHHFLKEGDEVKIDNLESGIKKLEVKANSKIKLKIIFENNDFLVINKPAGLVVHQSEAYPKADTLVNGLLAYYPKIKKVGEDSFRPGIIHRLDRDVSGLMVVAKNEETFSHLKNEFKNRRVKKVYTTLVCGEMIQDEGEIDFPIERSKSASHKMAGRAKTQGGRLAVTEYEVIKKFINYTLVKAVIKTGRTHQIRVHFNALGYPVVGDKIYRPKKLKTKIKLDRLFLEATGLGFNDLEGNPRDFKIELEGELQKILKEIK